MTCNRTSFLGLMIAAAVVLSNGAWAGPEHDHTHDPAPAADPPASNPAAPDSHRGHDDHDHDEHADEVRLTPEAIERYGVHVGAVTMQPLVAAFVAPARAAFNTDAMAHVGSAVTGRASRLNVKLGDPVKAGEVLVIVDSPELGEAQSDFLLKRTRVDTARPAVELARSAYERAKLLLDQSQGIALSEVQRRETDLRTAEGELRAAEAAATAAENKLHLFGMTHPDVTALARTGEIVPQYRVLAPIDGQVVEREVTLGELVRPDREALLIIADLSTVWVIADVPEARMGDVAPGSPARVKVAALRDRTLEGKVTYVAPALDPNTRSAKVRIEVHDHAGVLRPGMFAQATILPATTNDAVPAIPEEAVQTIEGGPAVFVPVDGEPNTFAKRPVRIGPPTGGMVQVLEGLRAGQPVVVAGSFILKAELGKAGAAHEH